MPIEVTCTVTGERESVAAFDAFDTAAKDALREVLSENGDILLREFRSGEPSDTGRLRKRTTKSTSNDGLTVAIKASPSQWAYAEWGVGSLGAGTAINEPDWFRSRRHMIPKFPNWSNSVLALWAKRRGLVPYLVARGIFERRGVRARPFITPSVDRHKGRILEDESSV